MESTRLLTRQEKEHLREMGINTIKDLEETLDIQRRLRQPGFVEPCWTCRGIAKKLGYLIGNEPPLETELAKLTSEQLESPDGLKAIYDDTAQWYH